MVQRVASVSHVAVLPDAEREAVLDEVREVLRTDPERGAATSSRSPTGSTASGSSGATPDLQFRAT